MLKRFQSQPSAVGRYKTLVDDDVVGEYNPIYELPAAKQHLLSLRGDDNFGYCESDSATSTQSSYISSRSTSISSNDSTETHIPSPPPRLRDKAPPPPPVRRPPHPEAWKKIVRKAANDVGLGNILLFPSLYVDFSAALGRYIDEARVIMNYMKQVPALEHSLNERLSIKINKPETHNDLAWVWAFDDSREMLSHMVADILQ